MIDAKIFLAGLAVLLASTSGLVAAPATQPSARALFKAVQSGDVATVKMILESQPALVNARDLDHGAMPLHHAKTVEIAAYLLDKGAELEALDRAHCGTPLRWAAGDRRDDVAKFLREKGAKVEDVYLAIALGDVELVKKFLA